MSRNHKNILDYPIRLIGRDGDEHARFAVSRPYPDQIWISQGLGRGSRIIIDIHDAHLVADALKKIAEAK